MKMKIDKVYQRIDQEVQYQKELSIDPHRPDMVPDFQMGSMLSAMRVNMNKAEQAWYRDSSEDNYKSTLEYLRKVAALIVSQGEVHGMPKRDK